MASKASDTQIATSTGSISRTDRLSKDETALAYGINPNEALPYSASEESLKPVYDDTHRKLKPRHIQLIGIGGSAGLIALSRITELIFSF